MQTTLKSLFREYEGYQAKGLKLDLTRGKPSPEQLDLSQPLLDITTTRATDGTDCRNYGGLTGIPEARELFGEYLGVLPDEVIVGGNSSLALMHDLVVQCLMRGLWVDRQKLQNSTLGIKFICPSPGYDRHFTICEKYGIEMIPVEMSMEGPDMNSVLELVKDPSVVGMWCVPKFSNPTGIMYSPEHVQQLASMQTGNPNFRIFWDNAYAVHQLFGFPDELYNIHEECRRYRTESRVFSFGSTSKITFAGSGISAVAMSKANCSWYLLGMEAQTIGHDKVNQLRHVLFLRDMEHIRQHMERHAEILRPKFEAVDDTLLNQVAHIAKWTQPLGGYFVSLDVKRGCAKRVVQLAANAGVKLTPAGATFPYGKDPDDSNIRIAPSFPSVEEVTTAMEVVTVCIKIAAAEKEQQ